MSERKVINKYYPADFDPSKLPRAKKKNKLKDVRIMTPYNMTCKSCGECIPRATKFNALKEPIKDEKYFNLTIYRFYLKCPRCIKKIILKTNLKDKEYDIESGATENYAQLKQQVKDCIEEKEAEVEKEKIDPMMLLENKTKASQLQIEANEQIHSIRTKIKQRSVVDVDGLIDNLRAKEERSDVDKELKMVLEKQAALRLKPANQPGPSRKKHKPIGSGW